MKISGFIIHYKDNTARLIERINNICDKYEIKLEQIQKEDYSWKIDNFQKSHIDFSCEKEKIERTVLLKIFNEIMLKEPSEIEIFEQFLILEYYTTAEQFGSTKDNEQFGIFMTEMDNVETGDGFSSPNE